MILLSVSTFISFAQEKQLSQMSKAEVLKLSIDELYLMSLDEVMQLSEIAGVSVEELYKLVSTSSRAEEPEEDAPNVTHIIDHAEIKYRGYKSLREVLTNVPGFGVFMKDVQYVAQVRGIAPNDNEKISFMLNGHRINQMSEPDLLNSPINLSNVERIEIIVGPGSVLYGAESLVATVNLITRKAFDNEISVTGGFPNEFALNALLGKVWDTDKHISFSFTGMQREGWNAYKVGGVTPDSDNAFNQLARANSTLPQKMYPSYFLTASGQHEGWSIDMSSYSYSSSRIGWAGSISLDERDKLHNQDYFNSIVVCNTTQWTEKWNFKWSASFDNKQVIQPNNLTMTENSYKTEVGVHHTTERNFLQTGIQLGSNQERNNWVYDRQSSTETLMYPLILDENLWTVGIFVSDKFTVSERFKLVGAVRGDYNTVLAGNRFSFSPRVAAIFTPMPSYTAKLMFNTATRFPSARASRLNVFDATKPDRAGRMVTQPEQLMTAELQNIYHSGNTKLSLVGYYQYLKNFISWFNPFMNIGDFSGWGLEAAWQTNFSSNISIWANATYNKTNFSQSAQLPAFEDGAATPTSISINEKGQMIAVPQFTANAGADICIFNRLFFSPKMNYFTGQPAANYDHSHTVSSPTLANPNNEITVFDFFYVNHQVFLDAALTCKQIVKGLDLRIAAQNILNNQHQLATVFSNQTYTPQGITFQATLFYQF
ncbi:MAG: TonB-dependent receptor plug domain-containing protein [Bacteroidales bacterium]|nr:TonB-dependent receptor plug domain-containing protein [Bacteroidales bacterium]